MHPEQDRVTHLAPVWVTQPERIRTTHLAQDCVSGPVRAQVTHPAHATFPFPGSRFRVQDAAAVAATDLPCPLSLRGGVDDQCIPASGGHTAARASSEFTVVSR